MSLLPIAGAGLSAALHRHETAVREVVDATTPIGAPADREGRPEVAASALDLLRSRRDVGLHVGLARRADEMAQSVLDILA